jgi:HK97 family phage major capsid protein
MQKQLATAQGRMLEIGDEMEAIGSVAETENRDLTEEDNASIKALTEEFGQCEQRALSLQTATHAKNRIAAGRLAKVEKTEPPHPPEINLPAKARQQKSKYFASNQEAFACGKWIEGGLCRRPEAQRWLKDYAPDPSYMAAMQEGTDSLGGYSVPSPMAATIIELVQRWGIYRQFSRNVTMTSETLRIPKLAASLTVYYPDEGAAITASDLTFDQVLLTAVKYAQLGILSTELQEDSVISVVDLLVRDMARNFANREDYNGFLADGVADPAGITGIGASLAAGAKITATASWDTITLNMLEQALGKLKEYGGLTPRWFMSRYAYYTVVMDLLNTAGGTDMRQIEQGGEMMLMGAPVSFTQVLPAEGLATGDLAIVCGDLDLGTYLGTNRQVSIRTLTELYAANDQLGVIGTLRSVSVCHDIGTATEAGSIVGIYAGTIV